jgi:hypothetical protein
MQPQKPRTTLASERSKWLSTKPSSLGRLVLSNDNCIDNHINHYIDSCWLHEMTRIS